MFFFRPLLADLGFFDSFGCCSLWRRVCRGIFGDDGSGHGSGISWCVMILLVGDDFAVESSQLGNLLLMGLLRLFGRLTSRVALSGGRSLLDSIYVSK